MPTYEYACKDCGHQMEVFQSFSDDALTTCPACAGSLRKVFGSVGITFKGSGFYKTDSRGSSKRPSAEVASAPTDAAKSTSESSTGESKSSTDNTASKPGAGSGKSDAAPKPASDSKKSEAAS